MEQRISIITLGVADLKKARKFYVDGLGFKPSSASQEGIVFIQMGCIGLALFNHDALAEDATVPPSGVPVNSAKAVLSLCLQPPEMSNVDAALIKLAEHLK